MSIDPTTGRHLSGAGAARRAATQGREIVAGCVMPTDAGIALGERAHRSNCESGSRALLEAMVQCARRTMPGSALAALPLRAARHG